MEKTRIFVYAKNNKIAVLSFHEASNAGYILEQQGYVHTATLDAGAFIENLHNYAT